MWAKVWDGMASLWSGWAGLDDHVQTLILAALLAVLVLGAYRWTRRGGRRGSSPEPETLSAIRSLAILLVPVWFLLMARILWGLWQLSATFDPSVQGVELRWHVLAFIGLVTALGGLVSAPLALIRVWTTERQVRTTEQGHMTDRITKAVEQLGAEKEVSRVMRNVTYEENGKKRTLFEGRLEDSDLPVHPDEVDYGPWQVVQRTVPNIEVRIGGLLSLERIAQDSTNYDKGRDHVRVMEILCAYVRENAPAEGAEQNPLARGPDESLLSKKPFHSVRQWIDQLDRPRNDIQIALTIIGRRSQDQIRIEQEHRDSGRSFYRVDLSHTCLRKANLDGADLSNAVLFKSLLEGTYCNNADLSGTNLIYAKMTGLTAVACTLDRADLSGADVSEALLDKAKLKDVTLSHTRFVSAQLCAAEIRFPARPALGTVNRAFFNYCTFGPSNDLEGSAAVLKGDLHAVSFEHRNIETLGYPPEINGMGFRAADLSSGTVPKNWMDYSFGDANVTLPEGRERPAHWPRWELPNRGKHNFDDEWRKWQADPEGYVPPDPPGGGK